MPDPFELFTNVYVKGFGVEVSKPGGISDPKLILSMQLVLHDLFEKFIMAQIQPCQLGYMHIANLDTAILGRG